jgi:hypothetical protein
MAPQIHNADGGVTFAGKQLIMNICVTSYRIFDRNDEEFVKKHGKRKAFHTGGNSSCRLHIRQHYGVYQQRCKERNIPEHHWAMPRAIWKRMQDEKRGVKEARQGTLDELIKKKAKEPAPQVFTRENLLHSVTQFIAVDDQVNTHQGSDLKILSPAVVPFCRRQSSISQLPGYDASKVELARSADNL